MRTRSGKGSDGGSGSESDARSSSRKGGSGKVRRHSDDHKSLVRTAWTLVKQVFFTIVHIYKSLTAFWSQMHVCMLPALGELDNEQEDQDKAEQDTVASGPAAGSPQRKRSTKVN
ncbi:AAEL017093-PA [Aedes aegypti]|uniref:AAEL017093-PA n=1 Tax=Aedes aegypti TaxID=7159 RepID=J9HSX3_AEDAE|nr:AAEL017093-PA [Aedes aegypti]